jgi:Outer membrane protein beta-barrel domain
MKKTLVAILFLLSQVGFAQNPKTQYGLKIGANLAYVNLIENPFAVTSRMKINGGAGAFYRINVKKVSIQPEVYYQGLTHNLKSDLAFFSDETIKEQRQVYQYISVPVLFGYEVVKGVHLVAGPQYSWTLNAGTGFRPNANNDFGIAAGVRIDMLDAMSLFSLNFRYVYGFTDQTDRTYTSEGKTLPYDFRNRTVQVAISYDFSDFYRWWRVYGVKKKKKN